MGFALLCILFLLCTGFGSVALQCFGAWAFFAMATPLPWLFLLALWILFTSDQK